MQSKLISLMAMRLVLFISLILGSLWQPIAAQPCDLKRDTDGIRVFTCKVEEAKFKSLRAEFILNNINKKQLKHFVWQVHNYATWQYNLMDARVVDSSQNQLAYQAWIDAPWPAENREILVNMKVLDADSSMQIVIDHITDAQPPPENFVRVPFFQARWEIVPQGNNLHVTYSLRIDPGGYVPAWLVNIAMADGPYISFKNLKAQLNPK
jgi:hypothetical protein